MLPKPLVGVRVLDLTHGVAGPATTQLMGDLGAEVIKIEPTQGRMQPYSPWILVLPGKTAGVPHYNRSPYVNEMYRSKLDCAIDLRTESGRQVFLDLARVSDVVVENFSSRVMKKFGLEYAALRAVNPTIIMVSLPAFGRQGPWRDKLSWGPGINASSGFAWLTGYLGGPPMKAGNYYADFSGGLHAAFAAVLALRHRQKTGRGQLVEAPLREAEMALLGEAFIGISMEQEPMKRLGNRDPLMAPHGCYPCRGQDRWAAIAVRTEEEWTRLCHIMGRPGLLADPRFRQPTARWAHQDELDKYITDWTSAREQYQVMRQLQDASIPCGAVLDCAQLVQDPHVRARQAYLTLRDPDLGDVIARRQASRFSRSPMGPERPGPRYAEHNTWVFGELLGLGQKQQAQWEEEGVTSRVPLQSYEHSQIEERSR
ncbi:MAG: CoA transferase [Chloroflexi bacterium]|nr:CoA transferase [Chloroflexota bacterium]